MLLPLVSGLSGEIFISEYSDADGTGNYIYEFVEIYNNTTQQVDISGYVFRQLNSTKTYTVPASTNIPAKGYYVLGRNADQAAFETFWNVDLGESVFYQNSTNSGLAINGAEVYLLENSSGSNVDPTVDDQYTALAVTSGNRVHRLNVGNSATDWALDDNVNASPGRLDTDQTLAVELGSWEVEEINAAAVLSWTTHSEYENLGFILERWNSDALDTIEIASFTQYNALQGHNSRSIETAYTFTDRDVHPGATYWYRLSDVDYSGKRTYYAPLEITMSTRLKAAAQRQIVAGIYPNPFNPGASIHIDMQSGDQDAGRIEIRDLCGRQVSLLWEGHGAGFPQQLIWDGTDRNGLALPSGPYVLLVHQLNTSESIPIMLLR